MARDPFRGHFAAALLLAAALAAGCGESVEDRLAQAKELQESQQFEPSLAPLRSVLEEEPGHPEASYRLGLALAKTGNLSGAVFPLRQAADSDAFAVDAGLMLAQVFLATGNRDQAHATATRVLERDANQIEALALRVQTSHALGQYEGMLADAQRLAELEPGPRGLSLRAAALESLGRFDEERKDLAALEALHRERGDLAQAAQSCALFAATFEKSDGNLARGIPAIEECLTRYPTQPIVLQTATRVLPPERSLAIWSKAAEEAPESLELRLGYADQLRLAGKHDEALAQVRSAAEDFRTAQAWLALAEVETSMGHPDEADAAFVAAAAAAPQDTEMITLRRADLRVTSGDLDGAEKLADEIKDEALADILRGHVRLERGDAEGALELLEKALERYPNHPGGRTLAGRAAERLGQTERALAHYREVVRADPGATNAGVLAAQIASSLGRHAEAVEYVGRYLGAAKTPPDAHAYSLAVRSAHAAGMPDAADLLIESMSRRPDLAGAVAVEKAWLAQQSGGPEAAARSLGESGIDLTDPANEPALRALIDAELALGRTDQALARADAALAKSPERASLHDVRGRVLLQTGRGDAARSEFERAVAADPGYGPAKAGLGALAFQAGDLEKAISLFDEAAQAPLPDPEAGYRAAQAAQALGRKDEAEQRYRAVLVQQPDHVGASNDLAWTLAEQKKDLDAALDLAQRAVRLSPIPSTWDTLAFVQMQRGEGDAARKTLEQALAQQPGQPTLLYRLGLVRKAGGDRAGAADAFRQALEAGVFPESEATRAELANLERSDS
jgi:tetratricopeptide (TPR) repeat protein